MRTHSRVYTFRTRETQTGPGALSTPETAVFTGRRGVRGRRLPPLSGRSLPPRRHNPARDVEVTRHQQGFPGSRPSGLSPRLWPPWLGRRPLGSSASFAPSRSGTGHARHGGDRSNTNPELRPWHPPDLLNQLTHHVRPRVATPALPADPRIRLPPASPRRYDGREIEVFHLHSDQTAPRGARSSRIPSRPAHRARPIRQS